MSVIYLFLSLSLGLMASEDDITKKARDTYMNCLDSIDEDMNIKQDPEKENKKEDVKEDNGHKTSSKLER